MKECTECNKTKGIEEFSRLNSFTSKRMAKCKDCYRAKERERAAKNRIHKPRGKYNIYKRRSITL